MPDPATPWIFEEYLRKADAKYDRGGSFLALSGERITGMSTIMQTDPANNADIGWTGTHPDFRGRGIAQALKLKMVDYLQRRGHPSISTTVNSLNGPMLAVNEKFGFRRQMAWVYDRRQVGEE
jgi:RimJ/RimL family protein N-acetyltransferase